MSFAQTTAGSRRVWAGLLAALVFVIALVVIDRVLGRYSWSEVVGHFTATPARTLIAALLLTVTSYLILTLYDWLGVKNAGASLPWRTVAMTSFAAYAIGHNAGMAALSGGSVRYRVYSNAGLSGAQIAQVIVFCSATFALGASLLCGISLLMKPDEASAVLHVGTLLVRMVGMLLIAGVVAYVVTGMLRTRPLQIRGRSIRLPGLGMSVMQVLVSSADLVAASAVLYVLLPDASVNGYLAFLGVYLLAAFAGLVSSVPGGLGVFETVLLVLMPEGAAAEKLGAILAYRVIYYLLPFLLALATIIGHEVWVRRSLFGAPLLWITGWIRALTPQFIAGAVFLCGVVLLVSGATPALDNRLSGLREIVPLSLLEASHLIGSAIGVALLLLAQSLRRRLDAAWHITMALLCAGAIASVVKGFDYEEASLLVTMTLLMWLARRRFHRKASLLDQRFSAVWLIAAAVAILSSLLLAWWSFGHFDYSRDLWWQFAFNASAPRSMRAVVLSLVIAGVIAAWLLLRPAAHNPPLPDAAELERARALVEATRDTNANLAYLGDKNLLFAAQDKGFVMFRPVGDSWIAMGDPVGPPEVRAELVWMFREACDRYAAKPVFYQVSGDDLPNYLDAGFTLSKLGEEARVALVDFTLEGGRWAELRQIRRKAEREGASFEVIPPEQVEAVLPDLRRVSDAWLAEKSAAEKGFSLGRFEPAYLVRFPCAIVRVAGQIVAFANIWKGAEQTELSVDLMRYGNGAPRGVMDYLFIEMLLWGRASGYKWFSLGMAPLSGLVDREFAPLWSRVGAFLYRHGEHFYNFEGLRRYKEKFHPLWRPRYLASSGQLVLPKTMFIVTGLVAGSPRRAIMR